MTRQHLLWCALETTGSDPERNSIVELAFCLSRIVNGELTAQRTFVHLVRPTRDIWALRYVIRHQQNGIINELQSAEVSSLSGTMTNIMPVIRMWCGAKPVTLAGLDTHLTREFIRNSIPELSTLLRPTVFDMRTLELFYRQTADDPTERHDSTRAGSSLDCLVQNYRLLSAQIRGQDGSAHHTQQAST